MSFKQFLFDNYIWMLVVLVILVIGVIGFIVDSKQTEKEKDNSKVAKEKK